MQILSETQRIPFYTAANKCYFLCYSSNSVKVGQCVSCLELIHLSVSDVHSGQHTSDAPQLPGRPDHVFSAEGV